MKAAILLLIVCLFCGCVTGNVVLKHSFEQNKTNSTELINKTDMNITILEEPESQNKTAKNTTEQKIERKIDSGDTDQIQDDATAEQIERKIDPCEGIVCNQSKRICSDGYVAVCQNSCQNGQCTECIPDCTGHECDVECGKCEKKVGCECQKIRPCCGDGICDPEEECKEDCMPKIIITEIMYAPPFNDFYNEWIEIKNIGNVDVNLSGWSICDDIIMPGWIDRNGSVHSNSGMILKPGDIAIITDGGSGTEAYQNYEMQCKAFHTESSSICGGLSNKGDKIVIKDASGNVVDSISYSPDMGAKDNGMSLVRDEELIESEPNPCA